MSQLNDMELFLAAARCGSFTQAAEEMHTSVAAVSRAIARLEQYMDCRLFNRTSRTVNLTSEGRLAVIEISAGIARLKNARALLHEQRQSAAGVVRVLMSSVFAKHYIMPELPAFLERYPQLDLDVFFEDFGADLIAGGFDIAVQFAPVPSNGYISRTVGTMEILLVASKTYLERYGVPRTIEDLDRHKCLQLRRREGGEPFQWPLQHVDGGPTIIHKPAGQFFINSQMSAIIDGARYGLGIAPLDVRTVAEDLYRGDLKVVLPDYRMVGGSDVILLYPHRDHVPLKARVFMDLVIDVGRRNMTIPGFNANAYAA